MVWGLSMKKKLKKNFKKTVNKHLHKTAIRNFHQVSISLNHIKKTIDAPEETAFGKHMEKGENAGNQSK